ncbi:MAG: ATP-dependent sacrificial sulfur transferase LarE [Candidatus Humimicrobiaceae bacterium]
MANKKDRLIKYLCSLDSAIIAFSGGTDSSLLSFLAKKYCKKCLAVTVNSPLLTKKELIKSKKIAKIIGINQKILDIDPLCQREFRKNPKNRCYLCKKFIFKALIKLKEEDGFFHLLDGTNFNDLGKHRPGLKALSELGINSPFAETKIGRKDITSWLKQLGLENFISPSSACLASRIPYGISIDKKKLAMVENAEELLFNLGFSQVRVRYHPPLARIEVGKHQIHKAMQEETRAKITQGLKKAGFKYVTLDLEGFRSGSLDEY